MFLSHGTAEGLSLLDVVAVKLALEGQFDARIAELKKVTADLEAKQSVSTTLAKANKLMAEAQARSDAVDAREAAAEAAAEVVKNGAADVAEKLAEVATREHALAVAKDDLAKRVDAFTTAQANVQASMTERERVLAQNQTAVQAGLAALESQKKAFNDKLNALKA